ncbi:MAG: hypothetical protein RIC95_00695 [Vicingaceae bacterium]
MFSSIEGTKLHFILKKTFVVLKRYSWLLLLSAILAPVSWHFYKNQQSPSYETVYLLKNNQLNSKLAEQLTAKLSHSKNLKDSFPQIQLLSFVKEVDNFDWFRKIDLYEKIAPNGIKNWIEFQETITIKVISSEPMKKKFSTFLVQFFDNHHYIRNLRSEEKTFLEKKINLLNQEIDKLENVKESVSLKLKRLDLKHAKSNIVSTKVLFQSNSSTLPAYSKLELLLVSLLGLFLMLILLVAFTKA